MSLYVDILELGVLVRREWVCGDKTHFRPDGTISKHEKIRDAVPVVTVHYDAGETTQDPDVSTPAIQYADGTLCRCNGGQIQSSDPEAIPAVELAGGDKHYCLDGQLHRTTGPAVESAGGDQYYLFGVEKTYAEWLAEK